MILPDTHSCMDLMRTTTTMSYHLCIVLILLLELHLARTFIFRRQKRYSTEEICHHTEETLRDVKICPQSDTIWLQQMQIKNCSSYSTCKGEPLVYHCVKLKDTFAEVCAPSVQIIGKCCTVFDKGVGRIREDFTRECPECPMQYSSDRLLLQCVESTSFTTTERTDTTVDYRLSAAATAAAATTRLPHKRVRLMKFMPKKDSSQTENDISRLKEEENTLLYTFFIVLIIPVVGGILFYMKCKDKIGARRHQKVLADTEESETPLAT